MNALVPAADGVEEIEVVTIVDTLRRAEWHVTLASVGAPTIQGSRGIQLVADALWDDVTLADYDLLVLPGGADNARTLAAHPGVREALRRFRDTGRTVAAICAAPTVLHAAGVLDGKRATSYPGVRDQLTAAQTSDERVVVDGNVITSQGPGTALEFALTLVRQMESPEKAARLAEQMLARI